jgi:hypothetical protein
MWVIIASALLGAGLLAMVMWLRSNDIRASWWEWLLGVIGLIGIIWTIQNFITAFWEEQVTAAWMFWVLPGIPAILLLAIAALSVWRKTRTA